MKHYKYEAIAAEIEEHIIAGRYRPGDRLPSIRILKEKFNTSISTIQNAYDYLLAKGLVESLLKSGYYVSASAHQHQENTPVKSKPVIVRDAVFKHHLSAITTWNQQRNAFSEFNVAAAGDAFIPQKLVLRTMQQVIRSQGIGLLRYYPANGAFHLREQIVRRAAQYHTGLHAGELIITDGALQALYIALASVCAPGDVVALESPCIFSILEVIRMLKLKVVEIPVDVNNGFDIDYLKKVCTKHTVKAIVVTPNFHNPTGTLLSNDQKKYLLHLAQLHQIVLIENDVYGDLNFTEQRPCNIKAFDDSGLVMTYTSYSKSLAAGVRLGWLSAGRFFHRAEQLKFAIGSTVAPIYQETVGALLQSNSYDRHIRSFRMQLAKQAYHTLGLLASAFPPGTRISTPKGGYNMWVQMDARVDMTAFYSYCEKAGIRFTPGYTFSFAQVYHHFFRVVFADKYSRTKEKAIRLAGQTAHTLICTD
ncbi:PLP-dependent aminotransferase family protein [Chitinophaga defluvii]|uniref:PLP-dependent aminotransferase family protein n=1 Tax=Chitinophaga defluvii TaxID=3163343 RepID=A0ABV2T4X4_9BACT